ncbi:MAG TPA: hypothetical protein VNX01_00430 [Bacteroidia bacterium]|jgi:hypothetical protein|nr:hypothetical protein [Bacteroidia bacterium]
MQWKHKIIKNLIKEIKEDTNWKEIYRKISLKETKIGVHLAVFVEPFATLVLEGQKIVESRFSINRIGPYGQVAKGDIIVIKKSGGPVLGFFSVGDVKYYNNVNANIRKAIESNYGYRIGTHHDPKFWDSRQNAKYATLIHVEKIKKTEPYIIEKKDRMAWVVIRENASQLLFD